MVTNDTFKEEISRVMGRAYPPIIMTIEDVADICGLSVTYVRNEIQHQVGFPPKLDRFKQPRWSRDSILRWAEVIS